MGQKLKVAILDDYQGFADSLFDALDSDTYEVVSIKDTLLPYNHPDTPESVRDELAKRLEPFDIISTMRERTPFPRALVERLPNLKFLLTTGLRNASLDLKAFEERGIPVAGAADTATGSAVGTDSTTQHCVAIILALVRNIARDDVSVKTGGWQTGFASGLRGKVLGVVGLGRLGAAVGKIMTLAFGMKVVAWSTNLTQDAANKQANAVGMPVDYTASQKTFKVVSRDELFSTADVVSVHLVLSDRSRGIITSDDLSKMRGSSFFVNTSRGPLVVEKDLLDALEKGQIRGAGLDVFDLEPLPSDSRWRTTKWGEDGRSQVLLTPHMGYVEENTINAWYQQQVENIRRWKEGEALVNGLV